jgi:hypothetical protein
VIGFLVTVACGSTHIRARSGRHATADLTPASRRQDHTTSPSASAPFVCMNWIAHGKPALRSQFHADAAASTASCANVRDDRDTPLMWSRTARVLNLIWANGEAEYFLKGDWTRQISLIRLDKFDFARKSVKWGKGQ